MGTGGISEDQSDVAAEGVSEIYSQSAGVDPPLRACSCACRDYIISGYGPTWRVLKTGSGVSWLGPLGAFPSSQTRFTPLTRPFLFQLIFQRGRLSLVPTPLFPKVQRVFA